MLDLFKMEKRIIEKYDPTTLVTTNFHSLPNKMIDNAAAAVGTGTVGEGKCNISLGTSGTIFISSKHFGVDKYNGLHSFAHADGYYHLMGCMLSAASCNKWWMEDIVGTSDYAGNQAPISDDKLGNNHVYFLPYLMGERSPINDTNARGVTLRRACRNLPSMWCSIIR